MLFLRIKLIQNSLSIFNSFNLFNSLLNYYFKNNGSTIPTRILQPNRRINDCSQGIGMRFFGIRLPRSL